MIGKPDFDWIKRSDGTSEFQDFIISLPIKDRAKLLKVIRDIEEYGMDIAAKMDWVSKIQGDIFEIRSRCGKQRQRALYFHEIENKYVITHGFTKKTEKTPSKEIEHAIAAMKKYKEGDKNDCY